LGPVYGTVYGIVQEKEQRSKESMRMMGMGDLSYWLSWFAYYSIQSTVITLIGWAVLCINVCKYGSAGYIFLYMWLFGESIMGQIVFYQALFSRAKYSGLLSVLLFFMLQFINLPLAGTTSVSAKAFASLVPQVAASQMAVIWSDLSTNGIGLNSETVKDQIQGYSFNEGLWMMIVGLLLWALIGFYCDAVFPKQFGSRKHPCFMFFPSTYACCFSCCSRPDDVEDNEEARDRRSNLLTDDGEGGMEVRNLKPENYEPVATEVARQGLDGSYLRIENLEKTYGDGKQAV